jgi:hypothetical protein
VVASTEANGATGPLGDVGQPQLVELVGVELAGNQVVVDRRPRPA